MNAPLAPQRIAAGLTELWSPRVIGEIENVYLKVARLQGSLTWHSHEHEDELFLVLRGALRIELETGPVDLAEGELFIVPKGVRHNPVAEQECQVLLIESKTTLHTGSVLMEQTRSIAEQLRPLLPPV
jgi:mannose-6-phosphate isomerase-like protein (cupin superfamily)